MFFIKREGGRKKSEGGSERVEREIEAEKEGGKERGDVKMFSKYKKENRRQLRRGSRRVLTAEAAEWNPIICTVHTPSLQLYVSVCV